jgi:hypothetical protein
MAFWGKCEKIYSEEMRSAERMAERARKRVAQRIVKELGDNELAAALESNDPQGYTREFDWN